MRYMEALPLCGHDSSLLLVTDLLPLGSVSSTPRPTGVKISLGILRLFLQMFVFICLKSRVTGRARMRVSKGERVRE